MHLTKQKYYDSLDIGRITVNKAIYKIKNSLFQVKVSTNSRIKGDIFSEKWKVADTFNRVFMWRSEERKLQA